MNIAIIGAGLAGTLGAYYLAKSGHDVTIYDREPKSAMACSRANGGQVSVCNAETWNTWKNIFNGVKWMFQPGAPLSINPTPSIAKIQWLSGFLKHTVNGSHEINTLETILLGNKAKKLYEEIISSEEISFDRRQTGMLHVYTKEASYEKAKLAQYLYEDNDVEYRSVNVQQINDMDPAMGKFKDLVGGIITGDDWTGDPHKFCVELTKVMVARYRVKTVFNVEVNSVRKGQVGYISDGSQAYDSEYDQVVISNGHEITKFAKQQGDTLNVYPVKGYSITIDGVGAEAPSVSLLDDDKKIVTSKLGNRLRVAGTAELAGANHDIRRERIDPLLAWVRKNFPSVDTSTYSQWACLRPMNSNMMPIIRESSVDGVWYHGGHGHLGWTLSPATGLILSELINSK